MNVLCSDIPLRLFAEACDIGGVVYFIGQTDVPAGGCFGLVSGELPTSVLVGLGRSKLQPH